MVIFWLMILWKSCCFDFDNDNKGKSKDNVWNIADDMIEVVKNPKWSRASKVMEAYVLCA
jgi:hypothetical protein